MPQGIGVCGNVQPMFLVYQARQFRDAFGKLFACAEFSSSIFASSLLPFTAWACGGDSPINGGTARLAAVLPNISEVMVPQLVPYSRGRPD